MKKISYYLILIVVAGGALSSFWVYQRYFKAEAPKFLQFKVERGLIREVVKVRGEVVAEKNFDLEFPFSGTVERVFAKEGRQINSGSPLMKLETIDFELEINQLQAVIAQRQANLDKLVSGATPEDINIYKTKVENAKIALSETKRNLIDKLNDSYTRADDAIRNQTDQFFNNPRSSNPSINLSQVTGQLKNDLESERASFEALFDSWKSILGVLAVSDGDFDRVIMVSKDNLTKIKIFLDNAALALNGLTSGESLTQSNIDAYRSAVSTARSNVNTAITNLSSAEERLKTAESNLALANDELALKGAKTRSEDIEIANAQIEEVKSQIGILEEKIRKSFLYAPGPAKVTKIWFEIGEVFRPGQTAVSLSTSGHKLQADVSELDIGKISEGNGNEVSIRLDAFPDQDLKGKITSIDSREIIKEGDKYYRINIYMDPHGAEIRSGMNADLVISISYKEGVLRIPEFAAYAEGDKNFVKILDGDIQRETEVKVGISDGESIEVISGLQEGQIIIVSAD